MTPGARIAVFTSALPCVCNRGPVVLRGSLDAAQPLAGGWCEHCLRAIVARNGLGVAVVEMRVVVNGRRTEQIITVGEYLAGLA